MSGTGRPPARWASRTARRGPGSSTWGAGFGQSVGDRRLRLANKALQLTSGTAIIKPGVIIVVPPAVGGRIIEGRVLRPCSWCRWQLSAGR